MIRNFFLADITVPDPVQKGKKENNHSDCRPEETIVNQMQSQTSDSHSAKSARKKAQDEFPVRSAPVIGHSHQIRGAKHHQLKTCRKFSRKHEGKHHDRQSPDPRHSGLVDPDQNGRKKQCHQLSGAHILKKEIIDHHSRISKETSPGKIVLSGIFWKRRNKKRRTLSVLLFMTEAVRIPITQGSKKPQRLC